MKTSLTALVLLAFAGHVIADVPKKIPRARYESLWRNSPFTSKPLVDPGTPEVNPLGDYVLIGVSSIGGTGPTTKYRVTLMNKKNPEEERIYVDSDNPRPPDNFKIERVTRTPGDPLGTTVTLRSGANVGVVAYDEKLLTIAAPVKPAAPPNGAMPPNPNNPNMPPNPNVIRPPGSNPNLPGLVPPGAHPPRPRVIAPPPAQPGAIPPPNVQPNVEVQPAPGAAGGGPRPPRRRSY